MNKSFIASIFPRKHNCVSGQYKSISKKYGDTSGVVGPSNAEQSNDAFPSDTKKNPKDYMAVTLRSGREFESIKEDEKRKTEKEKQAEIEEESSWAV